MPTAAMRVTVWWCRLMRCFAPERDSVLDGSDVLAAASAERIDTAGFEVLNGADAINATDGNDGGAIPGTPLKRVFSNHLGGDNAQAVTFEAADGDRAGAGDAADSDQPSPDFSEWGSSGQAASTMTTNRSSRNDQPRKVRPSTCARSCRLLTPLP